MGKYEREICDLVDVLKRANNKGIRVNLLIGAGVSVSGNIPLAKDIIKDIEKNYPMEYERVEKKTYAECMAVLTALERRELISKYVDDAKINWAHMLIANLLKKKIINCVLTTNFDNLLIRACALENSIPGVYDLAAANSFRTELLFNNSVIHLHGQHTGFVLCNTESELENQIKNIEPTFIELNKKCMWIVIGYSGENDPIVKLFHRHKNSDNRLYWIGFKDQNPSEDLEKLLNDREKYCYYIKGYDADSFFIELCKKLEEFPPDIINTPFTYLYNTVDSITEYIEYNDNFVKNKSYNQMTKEIITKGINEYEKDNVIMAEYYFNLGLMEKYKMILEQSTDEEIIKIKEITDINKVEELIKEAINKIYIFEKSKDEIRIIDIELIYLILSSFMKEDNIKYLEKILEILNTKIIKCENEKNILLKIDILEDLYYSKEEEKFLIEIFNLLEKSELKKIDYNKYIKIKTNTFVKLAEYFYKIDSDKSINYLNSALELIENNKKVYESISFNKIKSEINLRKIISSKENIIYLGSIFECIGDIINEVLSYKKEIDKDIINKGNRKSLILLKPFNLLFSVILKYINEEFSIMIYKFLEEKLDGVNSTDIILPYLNSIGILIEEFEYNSEKDILLNNFIKILENYSFECIDNKELYDISLLLNEISYNLISKNESIFSKKLLDFSIKLNNNTINTATEGFYYLNIEKNYDKGKELYDRAINNEEDIILKRAVIQKKEIELANYKIKDMEFDLAKTHIDKALEMGIISREWEELFLEAKEIENKIVKI